MGFRFVLAGVLSLALSGTGSAADLVIHEWGTITNIHAADGTPATGLNRIDEAGVLPPFVHRFEPDATRQPGRSLAKAPGIAGRKDVTMRLETPVIYFHPPPGQAYTGAIDVKVRLRGGVLNEFYPDAEGSVALDSGDWDGAVLDHQVLGTLQWKGLRLHDTVIAPLTNHEIWIAPRAVNSASVFSPDAGEGEQFLFYRGVAHLDALMQTALTRNALRLRAPEQLAWLEAPATVPHIWFADIRADGLIAFREHVPVTLRKEEAGKELARLKRFSSGDYAPAGAAQLRSSMKQALLAQGLFADEAEAMLNTWKAGYFQNPGLRVFYIVPRAWTDYFLPLEFSVPARVNRVMLGRIDIELSGMLSR